ncbi:MAG TPA: integration host factor [Gammaproteobacteria bacterium]|nr:integration host factor [Gammaproteobacteria bacterium]
MAAAKKKTAKKKASKKAAVEKNVKAIRNPYSQKDVIDRLMDDTGLSRKEVRSVLDGLKDIIHGHIKPRGAGEFTLAGMMKIKRYVKPATKERPGRNPFTGESIIIKAKPKSKGVRVRPLAGLKKMVD